MHTGDEFARSLLDGARPVDPAARQAVDEALRSKSTDPVVHAAALLLAYRGRADLRLRRSHPRAWIPGLHELILSGHLDAAAYALPRLQTAYPNRPYLEYMAFVLAQLPPPVRNGRPAFVDDRRKDVLVVPMWGADTVVLDFCGASHQPGIPICLMDRWLARLGAHLVYLRDRSKTGYIDGIPELGGDAATTIDGLNKIVSDLGASRVVCFGNSAGATGAMRYARRLGAERVLALAPITGGPEYAKNAMRHLPPGAVMPWADLAPLYRAGEGVRTRILYGEQNAGDRQQSVRMAGLPGVEVVAVPGWESHHVVDALLRAGRLEQVLSWLVAADTDGGLEGLVPIEAADS